MTRSFCILAFCILGALTGCLPVPVVGSIDHVEVPPALSSPMAADDKLAILGDGSGTGDENDLVTCVRSATAKADTTLKMIPPQDFRNALFPWFELSTRPRTAEGLAFTLRQPAVRAKISELKLHYVVFIVGYTSEGVSETYGALSPGPGGIGFGRATQTSRISGEILDLREGRWPGNLHLSVSGTDSATSLLLLTVVTIPITESTACQELGRQLAAHLTGRPVPKPEPRPQAPGE